MDSPRFPIQTIQKSARMRARLFPPSLFDLSIPIPSLPETRRLHSLLTTTGLSSRPLLAAKLLRSYSFHNDLLSARQLFLQTPQKTTLLWNSIIRAHAKAHHFSQALSLFNQMLHSNNTSPDGRTFACLLRACSENSDPLSLKAVHGVVISSGMDLDLVVASSLVSCYSKSGLLDDAVKLFDGMRERDLVLWNSMISGFGYGGFWQKGLELFGRMRRSGERPDGFSLVGLISCFWDPKVTLVARGVHGFCIRGGYDSVAHVRSALVSMYSRCRCSESGYQVFRMIARPDLVTWSALITGFSQASKWNEALTLFSEMICSGSRPDPVLIASVLSCCASMASIRHGKEIHGYVFRLAMDLDVAVSCALIDMYSKCGFAELGRLVFRKLPKKNLNLITYNTAISSLGSHGFGHEAIGILEEMLEEGFKPDRASFSAVLCACCHSRLLEEGLRLFRAMREHFGIEPEEEHYVYIVKLLGMVGRLQEAHELIQVMPSSPGSGVWGALLWGCSLHRQSGLGEIVARRLFKIDPGKTAYKVMLSNIYACEDKWEDVESLRDKMVGLQKVPGLSWVNNLPTTREDNLS